MQKRKRRGTKNNENNKEHSISKQQEKQLEGEGYNRNMRVKNIEKEVEKLPMRGKHT